MRISDTIKANLALLGAVTAWASAFVAIRLGLAGYSPGSLAALRFFIASMCLGTFFAANPRPAKLTLRNLGLTSLTGLFGIFAYSLLLNHGQTAMSPGVASFIVAQTPVITSVLAIVIFSERPALITIVGIVISCLGVAIIVAGQPMHVDSNFGLIMVALATICGSIHTICQKYLLKELMPYHVTTLSTWAGTLALVMFLPQLLTEAKDAPIDSTLAVIFLGIVPSTIGQWLWSYGLSKTTVVRAAAYLYTMPIISTVFGWLIFSEVPTRLALTGGSIALIGAMLVKKDLTPHKAINDKAPKVTSA
ncbi:MAG TPA: DMT family transporter [Myxococcota bacterium]|nr:DMT family transporter [Myxococcota bacterium]